MEKVYVKNEDRFIYEVAYERQIDSTEFCQCYGLKLVAGYDYVDTDNSDDQGYVGANRFTDNVQTDSILIYPLEESLGERLKDEGYTVLKKLPRIYINKQEEDNE